MRALLVVLLVVGFVVTYWWWIAAVVGIVVLGAALLWLALYLARVVDRRHERRAAPAARADQQHAWVLAGDERGIYGDCPPKQID
jgi:hypothetical protein